MIRSFLFMVIVLVPAMAQADAIRMEAAVRQLLASNGVAEPPSLTVADRHVRGTPELLLTRLQLADSSIFLFLRCRSRKQCGDVIATATFASQARADDAYQRLTAKKQKDKKAIPVVHAGERVRLIIQTQTIRLHLPVKALSTGGIEQTVRVRDPRTRTIYSAVVAGSKEVRISE